jgi:hypothetical protein
VPLARHAVRRRRHDLRQSTDHPLASLVRQRPSRRASDRAASRTTAPAACVAFARSSGAQSAGAGAPRADSRVSTAPHNWG